MGGGKYALSARLSLSSAYNYVTIIYSSPSPTESHGDMHKYSYGAGLCKFASPPLAPTAAMKALILTALLVCASAIQLGELGDSGQPAGRMYWSCS